MDDPPTLFKCMNGDIFISEYMVRNILLSIKHLTQELDALMLFVGREGSGKSLFMRQVLYVFWWFLTQFELIDYPFDLLLIHFGIKELQDDRLDFDLNKQLKYRISDLDESKDDLGRDKHNDPKTQGFLNYMRRCRDESGIIALAQPQVSEFLPSIVLSRALFIFEVDYDMDDDGNITRGEYQIITFPRGKTSFSAIQNKRISRQDIKVTLGAYMHDPKLRYADLPKKVISFKGNFNHVDPVNTKQYLKKKQSKKWERIYAETNELHELKKDNRALLKTKDYFLDLLKVAKFFKINNIQISKGLKISVRTVNKYVQQSKERE